MASNALVSLKDGKPVTTSQLVAESFGKNHRDVLRSISNITESPVYLERNQRNFALVNYVDAKGERRPMYEMDRQGFEILAMGFTGEEALRWKFKYSDAFAAMEAALKNPSPQPTPAPVRKPIRSRDDLSFTQRDSQNQLQNWVVAHDRDALSLALLPTPAYALCASAKSEVGNSRPVEKRRISAPRDSRRYFCACRNGGRCWEAARLAGSFSRSANPIPSATLRLAATLADSSLKRSPL